MPAPNVDSCVIRLNLRKDNKYNAADEKFDKALKVLGGKLKATDKFVLEGTDMERCIFTVEKAGKTPPQYPRKAGLPTKKTL